VNVGGFDKISTDVTVNGDATKDELRKAIETAIAPVTITDVQYSNYVSFNLTVDGDVNQLTCREDNFAVCDRQLPDIVEPTDSNCCMWNWIMKWSIGQAASLAPGLVDIKDLQAARRRLSFKLAVRRLREGKVSFTATLKLTEPNPGISDTVMANLDGFIQQVLGNGINMANTTKASEILPSNLANYSTQVTEVRTKFPSTGVTLTGTKTESTISFNTPVTPTNSQDDANAEGKADVDKIKQDVAKNLNDQTGKTTFTSTVVSYATINPALRVTSPPTTSPPTAPPTEILQVAAASSSAVVIILIIAGVLLFLCLILLFCEGSGNGPLNQIRMKIGIGRCCYNNKGS